MISRFPTGSSINKHQKKKKSPIIEIVNDTQSIYSGVLLTHNNVIIIDENNLQNLNILFSSVY